MAVALVITLDVTSAAPLELLGGGAHRPHAMPVQLWGSAGNERGHGTQGNKTLPPSLRGRYPQDVRAMQAKELGDVAKVEAAPVAEVRGFDKATSKERPDDRGEHERTYSNVDGTLTTQYSTERVNYRLPDGKWAPIDTKLVAAENGWRTTADASETRFARTADAPEVARLVIDAEHSVGYRFAGASAATGVVAGNTITYPAAWPGIDVRVEARGGGTVKETLVLRGPGTGRSFDFPLRLTGLSAAMSGTDVVLRDASGRVRAIIPAGIMVDAGGATAPVTYELTGTTLRVKVDDRWLLELGRRFPVAVDPTMEIPVASAAVDSSMNVTGGGSTPSPSELIAGRYNNTGTAAYLKFGGLTSKLRFHTVYGAQLELANTGAPSCSPRTVTIHPVTQAWTPGTGYVYPGPSVGPAMASPSFAHGGPGCPPGAELVNLGAGGRNMVQGWANGGPNNGISLRANDSDSSAWKKFMGTGSAVPPTLYVTHSPYNASYEIANPVPDPPVLQNQAGKLQVDVTNLSAEDWPQGTYYLAYRAYNAVTGASVTQQRAADLAGTVPRNAKTTLTATIRALPPGKYFLDFTMVRNGGVVFTDQLVAPIRLVLEVPDVPPVITGIFPLNGYRTPTLTPQLWAGAADIDAPPGSRLTYKFEFCERDSDGNPVGCQTTAYQNSPAWTVPSGRMQWGKRYLWRAWVKDTASEVETPRLTLLADVPQPELTSRIANAPHAARDQEYDPQSGNFTSVATDAPVVSVGPELTVVRSYNSLDPRRDTLFGAGWTSRYDMRIRSDDDGTGNVIVTYPDGQEVRYGRNPDGSYVAPSERMARLTQSGAAWQLRDQSGSVYQFSLNGRLARIIDAANRSTVLTYNTGDGKLVSATAQASGRSLRFAWSGAHISTVTTDAGAWNYSYAGDKLSKVCGPDSACVTYDYAASSYYRGAALDSNPESYWRLGESSGTAAASDVAVKLGKDAGKYHNVQLGTAGSLAGSDNTAATFSNDSYVDIPAGTLKKSRDLAVEMWFKANPLGTGGPLIGYQDKAFPNAATTGVPVLYQGTDGLLHGQFATGKTAPVASTRTVNDGKWHHVVLSSTGGTTTLYLDGVKSASADNQNIDHTALTYNQIGAAYATSPASWPGWGSNAQRSFSGVIDEVAVYHHPLGAGAVAAHFQWGTSAADQLAKITMPSGKVAAEAKYDGKSGRIKEYVDDNGGAWQIGAPAVYGSESDLRRSVEVRDPGHRSSLFEYDALAGWLLRQGVPAGLEVRGEDRPGEPTGPPDEQVPSCPAADPADPKFCTIIPDSSGGPVFVRHSLEGIAIRSFTYDDRGLPKVVTNETGDAVKMEYDARGNITKRTTCRTVNDCQTAYSTFPPASADPLDPRSGLVLEFRDARSSGATDNSFLTSYTYTSIGDVASQTNPDRGVVRHFYTDGTTPAVGGGTAPSGLVTADRDARGAETRYSYFASGDLAQPSCRPAWSRTTPTIPWAARRRRRRSPTAIQAA
ncbi:LamG-like jellyroll fold domain-containing protein [Lentzea aerocolonigenes]|uniref:LamG-like jellyroll fold domain-containing protein n=1 Tax=Lentzea aerocolonigenes TaxID=68170 RepID=UPI0018C8A4F1|nr:LamG-like jellyroll fold domain-containing protein [Lentzea aerocolonigenes]